MAIRQRRSATTLQRMKAHPYVAAAGTATIALLAISALANAYLAKRAERENPPKGQFINIDGVRIHYIERGKGEPLVLLHGNGSTIEDFESSGLVSLAARSYRVIAFDRPGFGHSERPRTTVWTANAQAGLIHRALETMGIRRAIVFGHSWGASVAMALALNHPELVAGLVLASGYYYPTRRLDVIALSTPAVPVIGDVIRYAVSPLLIRLMWPLILRKIFGPVSVPSKFSRFPKEMVARPSQIRASAAESALMIPQAHAMRRRYHELDMPVAIIAGTEDRVINFKRQAVRLHRALPQSRLRAIAGNGHMVHQTATRKVKGAVDQIRKRM